MSNQNPGEDRSVRSKSESLSPREERAATDPYISARDAMVATHLTAPGRDIRDLRVLSALRRVPRHEFVPADLREHAYEDCPLPIGYGQTISQPFIVAFMTACLELCSSDRVLEVGTGCGYQTAILSLLAARVCTVEIVQALAQRARSELGRLGYGNIEFRFGDGWMGWSTYEASSDRAGCECEFDAILVSCAPTRLPEALAAQLKEGGRLVVPIGPSGDQTLHRFRKINGRLNQESLLSVRFVPMTGIAR